MRKSFLLVFLVFALFILTPPAARAAGTGTINGTILTQNTERWPQTLSAEVIDTVSGAVYQAQVQSDGTFSVDVPAGSYVVRVANDAVLPGVPFTLESHEFTVSESAVIDVGTVKLYPAPVEITAVGGTSGTAGTPKTLSFAYVTDSSTYFPTAAPPYSGLAYTGAGVAVPASIATIEQIANKVGNAYITTTDGGDFDVATYPDWLYNTYGLSYDGSGLPAWEDAVYVDWSVSSQPAAEVVVDQASELTTVMEVKVFDATGFLQLGSVLLGWSPPAAQLSATLSYSANQVEAGTPVTVTVNVTENGNPAPDGTKIVLTASNGTWTVDPLYGEVDANGHVRAATVNGQVVAQLTLTTLYPDAQPTIQVFDAAGNELAGTSSTSPTWVPGPAVGVLTNSYPELVTINSVNQVIFDLVDQFGNVTTQADGQAVLVSTDFGKISPTSGYPNNPTVVNSDGTLSVTVVGSTIAFDLTADAQGTAHVTLVLNGQDFGTHAVLHFEPYVNAMFESMSGVAGGDPAEVRLTLVDAAGSAVADGTEMIVVSDQGWVEPVDPDHGYFDAAGRLHILTSGGFADALVYSDVPGVVKVTAYYVSTLEEVEYTNVTFEEAVLAPPASEPEPTPAPGDSGGGGGGTTVIEKIIEKPVPVAVSDDATVSTITPDGGTIENGNIVVEVPPGAVNKDAVVQIVPVKLKPNTPAWMKAYDVYLLMSQKALGKPVSITFRYNEELLERGQSPLRFGIYEYQEETGEWKYVGGKVDTETKIVTAPGVALGNEKYYALLNNTRILDDLPGPDQPPTWWSQSADLALGHHVVGGYPDGTFKPERQVTRAEFAKMVVKMLMLQEEKELQASMFTDVSTDDWFANVVATAYKAGIIKGYPDGTFRPNQPITRQEMAAMLARALAAANLNKNNFVLANYQPPAPPEDPSSVLERFTDAAEISDWAARDAAMLAENGIYRGYPDGRFGATNNTTRAEVVALVARVLKMLGLA